MKILEGYTSPETAYVVNDYPYGFRLRCKIRYWLETNKNGTRLVSQTTNPKVAAEVWNKPKASTYLTLGVMGLNEDGHVTWDGLHISSSPDKIAAFKAKYPELGDGKAKILKVIEAVSRRDSPVSWAEHDAKQAVPSVPA